MKKLTLRTIFVALLAVSLLTGSLALPQAATQAAPAAEAPLAPNAPAAGADLYGYEYVDESGSYLWEEANGGQKIEFSNTISAMGPYDFGFGFKFYESIFYSFYVNTSGLITFLEKDTSYANRLIPLTPKPNAIVAPLWGKLNFPTRYGFVYFDTVGAGADQHAIIEWEIFTNESMSTMKTNFEVLLYPASGKVVFQYKRLTTLPFTYSVGIEDADGVNGLQYPGVPAENGRIAFLRPSARSRVNLLPRYQGSFAINGLSELDITVRNSGDRTDNPPADRYNLQLASNNPAWPVYLYDKSSGWALTDTDSDGTLDTGPIPQGQEREIRLRIFQPAGASPTDHVELTLTATSKLNPASVVQSVVRTAVPVEFSQIYVGDGAITVRQVWNRSIINRQVLNGYTGATLSMEQLSDYNYLTAWEQGVGVTQNGTVIEGLERLKDGSMTLNGKIVTAPLADKYTDIRYRVFTSLGFSGTERLLTDNQQVVNEPDVIEAYASTPSIARGPDGLVLLAWSLLKAKSSGGITTYNNNVYITLLDQTGLRIASRLNITNDETWNQQARLYLYQSVVATDDNYYGVCWSEQFNNMAHCGFYVYNGLDLAPSAPRQMIDELPSGNTLFDMTTTRLAGNQFLVTYVDTDTANGESPIVYQVWNSNGTQAQVRTPVDAANAQGAQPRAVAFGNGKVLIVWIELSGELGYALLQLNGNRYELAGPVQKLPKVDRRNGSSPSITLVKNDRAVVTWLDGDDYDSVFYAVFGNGGQVLTPEMNFISNVKTDPYYLSSEYGFGNSGYSGVFPIVLPLVKK